MADLLGHMIVVDLSPTGITSRINSSMVFHSITPAAPVAGDFTAVATAIGDALVPILLTTSSINRISFARMQDNNKVVPDSVTTLAVGRAGTFAVPAGDSAAHEKACVVIQKTGKGARPSRNRIRYGLTSTEFATYTRLGTLPARYGANLSTVGPNIAVSLMAALNTGVFDAAIYSKKPNGLYEFVPMQAASVLKADTFKVTRDRNTADAMAARGAQARINRLYSSAVRLYKQIQNGTGGADIALTIAAMAAEALGIYLELTPLIRGMVKYPNFANAGYVAGP